MEIKTKIKQLITALLNNIEERKKWILALSCLVVFFTTYLLILPAFTLDKEEAAEQGGIDVPGVEQSVDTEETAEESAENEFAESSSEVIEKEESVEPSSEDAEKEKSAKFSYEDVDKEEIAKPASENSAKAAQAETAKTEEKKMSADITLENNENDDFSVAVESKEAVLSENMSVAVHEIDQSSKKLRKEYDSLYSDALEAVQKAQEEEGLEKPSDFAFAKFYDISLMDGMKEVEPGSAVDVKISFSKELQKELKVTDPNRLHIVHFAVDKETGEVTPEVLDTDSTDITVENKKITEAAFTTESFSVFALVYTVDFSYSVNGKSYEFTLPGGGYASFTKLVEVLGIAQNDIEGGSKEKAETTQDTEPTLTLNNVKVSDATRDFVADVEKVEFSSPELLSVSKVDQNTTVGAIKDTLGLECEYSAELTEEQIAEINAQAVDAEDWALISLKAFDTEEYLTVTLRSGEVLKIKVTDDQENPFGLDGKTFAITAKKNNTNYYLSSDGTGISTSNQNCLKAYTYNPDDWGNPQGSNWTFEWTGEGKKYLIHDENNRYILIENNRVSLTDRNTALANPITVISREGKYAFVNEKNNQALNIYGTDGFGRWEYSTSNADFLMTLQEPSNLKKPGTIVTADTSGLLQINLFNYGPENQLDIEANNNTHIADAGINVGHTLKFFSYGKQTGNGINDFTGTGNGPRTGIVDDILSGEYPVIANSTESLAYLFGGESNDYVDEYYGLNHLFTKDEKGYYHYNSDQNYAYYDTSNGNKDFKVYSKTFPEEGADDKYYGVGFFPFNDYDEYYNCIHGKNGFEYWNPHTGGTNKAGHYEHHFGMSLTGNFIMPPGGQYNGEDISFEFAGDDDMWVYVDGVLIMDIGGIHNPVHGHINFTTGEVTVHGEPQENFKDKYKRLTGKDWDDSDFSNHDFRVFYMERGGMYSNLEVTFNLPLTEKTETGDFEFDKVSSENESLKLQGATFGLFTDSACTKPFTLASVPITSSSDDQGTVSFRNVPYGTYYMKETEYPDGYQSKTPDEIYTVTVGASGTTILSSDGNNVSKVTNEPKKTKVDVEKVWSNGVVPPGASVEIVLGRYKLVEAPNAQGKGTLVIKDSYAGVPDGNSYEVTYKITGPNNYTKTIRKSYAGAEGTIEETVIRVPAGAEYTVTKEVQAISQYNVTNSSETQTVTVPKNGSVDAQFEQSTFTFVSEYRVRVYAVNQQNWSNLYQYSENYYPAGSSLSVNISNNKSGTWNSEHCKFICYYNSQAGASHEFTQNGSWNFTNSLHENVDIYVYCDTNSGWTNGWDQINTPTITGATPVRAVSSSRRLLTSIARAAVNAKSQIAATPTLPDPPADTVYVLDTEYAQDPDTITLSAEPWTGSADNLDAYNEYGKYIYYIASVNEFGMPGGTQIAISDEVSMDGATQVLTVTNTVPTGNLQITKNIQKNGTTDTSATGTFYYAVFDEEYNPDADPAQTPVRTGSITVSSNGTQTVTEEGLFYGDYYVYELSGQGGTPIVSGNDGTYHAINSTVYKVTGSGTSSEVGETSGAVTINNNHETVSKTATKSWSDNNPNDLTIYFKLFYEVNNGIDEDGHPDIEDIEVVGAEVKELTAGTTSVTWNDLPKYDANGNEYTYLVKEYIMSNGDLVPAAPDGYVKIEDGLSVTNTKSEGYNPLTSYVGTKIWVDTANNGETRPEGLNVTLYANDQATEYVAQWTKGTGDKANEWTYVFSDLPVFDENGNHINYTVREATINGYDPDEPVVTTTSYQAMQNQDPPMRVTTNSNLDITLVEETDLAYIAIKKNANRHLIWTQRAITAAEKQKLMDDINEVEGFVGELSDSTVEFVDGLPMQHVFEKGTVTITKTSNKTMHVTFIRQNQWAQLCYGSYKYEYSPGTTSFTNRLHTIFADAMKSWVDASGRPLTPDADTTATFDLFINNEAQNKQVVLNGKTDVASADNISEDEAIAATQEVNAEAVAANAYESEPWKAYWGDLAEYDSEGNKIVYTVKEVDVSEGFANQNTGGVSSGGTITNKQTETEINILKVDIDGITPLSGAKFILRKYSDESYQECTKEWDEQEVSSEQATKGQLTITGLSVGFYELEESDSPAGYVRTDSNPRFVVSADSNNNLQVTFTNTSMVTYDVASNTFTVKNEPGAELPHTGGPGTRLFTIIGSILILGSGLLMLRRRRFN